MAARSARRGVVFAGLARDCARHLPRLLRTLAAAGARAGDWGYVFLENDSRDATLEILQRFDERHRRGIVRSHGRNGELGERFPRRAERLCFLRNECLDLAASDPRLSQAALYVVVDMDEVNAHLEVATLVRYLEADRRDRAASFANQTGRYYDVWTLRHPEWSPDDCWEKVATRPPELPFEAAVQLYVKARMLDIPPENPPIEVESAFGGLGIYDAAWIEGCRYDVSTPSGREVCEHVAFNRQIRAKGGRLFIEPGLVNAHLSPVLRGSLLDLFRPRLRRLGTALRGWSTSAGPARETEPRDPSSALG